MPIIDPSTLERLDAYLEADTRYDVAPIPTPLDQLVAEPVCISRITPDAELQVIERLADLTSFHTYRRTAPQWKTIIARPYESSAQDYRRSAAAMMALAWLGEDDQRAHALNHYNGLLGRADPAKAQEPMFKACWALAPADGAAGLRAWARREADRLGAELKHTDPNQAPGAVRTLESRQDMLLQFANLDTARLDRDLAARREIEAMPTPARARRLARVYARLDPAPSTELVWWAALTLNRLPAAEPKAAEVIQTEFIAIAEAHKGEHGERQPQMDAIRARAIRASRYFGGVPQPSDLIWAAKQPDPGIDLLVLRPDWEYPAPHTHGTKAPPPP